MPLTDITIKSAKPAGKPVRLYDRDGLYLEVAPSGGKWWRLKYRFAGKERRISLGVYPKIQLKRARDRAAAAHKLLAEGVDPAARRKAERSALRVRAANTFALVAREWLAAKLPVWDGRHGKRVSARVEKDLIHWLGAKPIADITTAEILETVQRIESRGALDVARRALRDCGCILRYACSTNRASADPTSLLRGALKRVNEVHRPAITKPAQVGELLRMIHGYTGTMPVRCALRLAPLVFVRPTELRTAQWSEIDFEAAEWRFRIGKTGIDHIVPLATQAIEILRELQPFTGRGRYVFPSARSSRQPMSDNAVLAAFRRMSIPQEEMCGHGFRAMARTILDEVLKYRVDIIEHQLAHKVLDPNGRAYNRTAFLEDRHEMMQTWANYLDGLRTGANVVPFPQRA